MKSSNISVLLSSLFLFYVQMKIPAGMSRTYDNVVSFFARDGYYVLTLDDNKTAYVPILFTVIEEK